MSDDDRKRRCERCGSNLRADFGTELCIHTPGMQNLSVPGVFVFPKLTICLECGAVSAFQLPRERLSELRKHFSKD